jgi:hypothetical protein
VPPQRELSRSKIAAALRRGGRQLNIDTRAAKIQAALRSEQLAQPATVTDAYGAIVASLTQVIAVGARAALRSLFVMLPCLSSVPFELLEELAGDVALQASGDRAVGLAFAASTFGVGACGGIGAESSDDDHVDCPVELTITGPVQTSHVRGLSSGDVVTVCPGGGLVVERSDSQAAVKDGHETVGDDAECS